MTPQDLGTDKDSGNCVSAETRDNLSAVSRFYEQEAAAISKWQRAIEAISRVCGSATYFGFVGAFILVWVVLNAGAARYGRHLLDTPPFPWLQGLVSVNALLLTIAVLIRQNRIVRLADHHAHLDLQINLLTEQKVSKLLQMFDELRRDLPTASEAAPSDVETLIAPADTGALLQAVKEHLRYVPM